MSYTLKITKESGEQEIFTVGTSEYSALYNFNNNIYVEDDKVFEKVQDFIDSIRKTNKMKVGDSMCIIKTAVEKITIGKK